MLRKHTKIEQYLAISGSLILLLLSIPLFSSCMYFETLDEYFKNIALDPDINVKKALSMRLGKSFESISPSEFNAVQEFSSTGNVLVDIEGIENCNNLQRFQHLGRHLITDFSLLSKLKYLESLEIGSSDEEAYSRINDISFIKDLTKLEVLRLSTNEISDIKPIEGLHNLLFLDLSSNLICDIKSLSNLEELEKLIIWNNKIESLIPLTNLENLKILQLSHNDIRDINPLVENLYISGDVIISLFSNPLSERAIYEDIPTLEARGVKVYYTKPADYDPSKIKLPDGTIREKSESD